MRKKGFNIFLSCDEAQHNCDKSQYNEASIWERIKLTIHLFYCRACREYTKNNSKLTELSKNPEVDCLKVSEKEQMKAQFKKELQEIE